MGGEGGRTRVQDVLVVDDDHGLRLLCRVNLELDGHTVREAATVADARAELAAKPPDVLLLDRHVGNDDGLDLLDEIEARGIPTRVVLISGTSEITPDVRARVAGVLGKPFELDALAAAIAGDR